MHELLAQAITADRLRTAETARRFRTAQRRRGHAGDGAAVAPAPAARLRTLVEAAAQLDHRDEAAWADLARTARTTTAALVADGVLPPHLAVSGDETPALLTRLLTTASMRATTPPHAARSLPEATGTG